LHKTRSYVAYPFCWQHHINCEHVIWKNYTKSMLSLTKNSHLAYSNGLITLSQYPHLAQESISSEDHKQVSKTAKKLIVGKSKLFSFIKQLRYHWTLIQFHLNSSMVKLEMIDLRCKKTSVMKSYHTIAWRPHRRGQALQHSILMLCVL
jgi:hypothetical protein